MLRLPYRFAAVILSFAPLFHHRSWRHAEVLLVSAILAPGTRTVASLLRICGLAGERRFVNYHRVLNRATWSPRTAAHLLLTLLIKAFAPDRTVVLGIDDTIERRRGKSIAARGIYRDPVRSSHGHFVKASGLRWLSLMLLVPIPWAERIWALPFLTALASSERYSREHGRRHKKLTGWAGRWSLQARRWLPGRDLVLVADSSFAALYTPAPPRPPGTVGRPRTKGERIVDLCSGTAAWRHAKLPVVPIRWVLVRDPLGRFNPQALLCTHPDQSPEQVLRWFVQRWQLEATFQGTRAHLGIETQRQWSDLAIARTTPCLLGLFSIVTLLAAQLSPRARGAVMAAAWYHKRRPTFSDTLAAVRRHVWQEQGFVVSRRACDVRKLRPALLEGIAYALCHAA